MYDEIAPSVEAPYAVCSCVTDELVSRGSVLDAIPFCDCVAEPADDSEPSATACDAIQFYPTVKSATTVVPFDSYARANVEVPAVVGVYEPAVKEAVACMFGEE